MASLKPPNRATGWRRESISVQFLPPEQRDAQVASLNRPWIAEEGPLAVRFTRLEAGSVPELFRGLAFDGQRTVTWDEDAVTVISPAPADKETVALENAVIVREKFSEIPELLRIDYVKGGVWQGSRYLVKEAGEEKKGDSHA